MNNQQKEPVCRSAYSRFPFMVQDSLAAEIEGTMRKELQMDDPEVEEQRYYSQFKRQ